MDVKRYQEEDFSDFVQELIDNNRLNGDKENGISLLVVDKGYEHLSQNQKYVFEKAISHYVYDECSRCGNDIPWSEMIAVEDNGGICSWCQQLSRHDND